MSDDLNVYQCLKVLGLSRTAIACYQCLCENGTASIQQIAARLELPTSSLYVVARALERLGFVESFKIPEAPTFFSTIRIDKALENYAIYQRRAVAKLIEHQVEKAIQKKIA